MTLLVIVASIVLGALALGTALGWLLSARLARAAPPPQVSTHTIAERVRAVGKLVALEVTAKEIATATSGWSWLPPLLLSQARLAMIFLFEKQYYVDLSRLGPADVRLAEPGRVRLRLPPVESTLRLVELTPYDIQNARVLGLLDVIHMNADRQGALMRQAQQQAAIMFQSSDKRYAAQARAAVERELTALAALMGVSVDVVWADAVDADLDDLVPALPPAEAA